METKNHKQSDKFIEAAKKHGCNQSEEAFSEKMKKIATAKLEGKKDAK